MSFRQSVVDAARAAGGSFQTRAAREQMVRQLAEYLQSKNIQIKDLSQLKGKHISAWIEAGKIAGLSARTLQNRLTAVRGCFRALDLTRKAESLKTRDMGVAGASREGTRRAIGDADLKERLARVADEGVKAALQLQRDLGLRQNEAIRGGNFDTLKRWEKELSQGGRIRVVVGTKGGRPRETLVVNREAALMSVERALSVLDKQEGKLIDAPGLKEARDRFNNQARAAGFIGQFSPHSLRYAFACDSIQRYRDVGFSQKEATAQTSIDLGHGDGRGRWVEHIYSRR